MANAVRLIGCDTIPESLCFQAYSGIVSEYPRLGHVWARILNHFCIIMQEVTVLLAKFYTQAGLIMYINFAPWIVTFFLIVVPAVFGFYRKRLGIRLGVISGIIFLLIFLRVYVPGWVLMYRSNAGDPKSMYDLARWTENHSDQIDSLVVWPFSSDVLGGYALLEASAQKDYPPALYAMGVRLKHGQHVPRPNNWTGAEGNVFPQPVLGQYYIDQALQLGYKPEIDEQLFYWHLYRMP